MFVSFLSHANEKEYERGKYVCTDESERGFKNNPQDLDEQYFHYSCEVIKGNDSYLSKLYSLADDHSHLLASDFVAHYLQTDGNLDNSFIPVKTLDDAIKYRMKTQVIIELIPNYPPEGLRLIEYSDQIELDSAYKLVHMYFIRYNMGVFGDFNVALLNSPSYNEGSDLETYPMYNTKMYDSLENIVKYAGECANLPQKAHFNVERYKATIKVCSLMREMALAIDPLEAKRKSLLSKCPDLNEENCPEYYKTHEKINELRSDYMIHFDELLLKFL